MLSSNECWPIGSLRERRIYSDVQICPERVIERIGRGSTGHSTKFTSSWDGS